MKYLSVSFTTGSNTTSIYTYSYDESEGPAEVGDYVVVGASPKLAKIVDVHDRFADTQYAIASGREQDVKSIRKLVSFAEERARERRLARIDEINATIADIRARDEREQKLAEIATQHKDAAPLIDELRELQRVEDLKRA
jgi:hypothetical protein